MSGSGKAIVLAVGHNTLHECELLEAKLNGREVRSITSTIDTEIETPL